MTSDAIDPAIVRQVVNHLPARRLATDPDFESDVLEELAGSGVEDEQEIALYLAAVAEAIAQRMPAAPRQSTPFGGSRRGQPSAQPAPPPQGETSAPYRFVTLNQQVAKADPEIVARGHDRPLPGGFCGSITVHWAFETPMLIGARQGQGDAEGPLMLGKEYVIPGATLRGLLRAACEIVGYGRLFQMNRHHRYAVRDFKHELFKDDARPSWESLHAGWLQRVGNFAQARQRGESGYTITPCCKHTIRIRDLPGSIPLSEAADGVFHKDWLGLELLDRYAKSGQKNRRGNRVDFSSPTGRFATAPDGEDRLMPTALNAANAIRGVFVFSGRFPTAKGITAEELDTQDAEHRTGLHKKHEYVFVDDPGEQPVPLSAAAFARFELAHTKPSKNKREPDGSYAALFPTLEAGDRIPVFYIGELKDLQRQEDPDFAIGLTRLFKRPHRHSVGDVLLAHNPAHVPAHATPFQPDMVEALFGYVFEKDELGMEDGRPAPPRDLARKGRVAFGFATAVTPSAAAAEAVHPVMMAPRASFGPFYLRGGGGDWTNDSAKLAGRKRYFPRFAGPGSDRRRVYDQLATQTGPPATQSHLRFLESRAADGEIVFKGEIRLHNVAAAEIGLLLWALTHGGDPDKPYRHMIGRAKPAGAGQTRVMRLELTLTGNDAEADTLLRPSEPWERAVDDREGWTTGSQGLTPFLRRFEDAMRDVDGKWPETEEIQEFLGAAHPGICSALTRPGTSYMPLQAFKKVRDYAAALKPAQGKEDRLLPAPKVSVEALRRLGYRSD